MKVIIPKETPTASEAGSPRLTPRQEIKREVVELVKMVLLFLIVFWGIKTFCIEGYEVHGPSMYPTLETRERILVWKLPQQLSKIGLFDWLHPVEQGDIIVFRSDDQQKPFVKRVIAAGPSRGAGNTVSATTNDLVSQAMETVKVEFIRGRVYVNNRLLEEAYLVPEERQSANDDKLQLHAGEYYVLGDHRSVSRDSRSFHAVDQDQIIGKAVLRFWPLSKFGLL